MSNREFIEFIEINMKIIDEDLNKGYWEGLYFQASLIEAILKFILITNLKKQRKFSKKISKHIEELGLSNAIKNCFMMSIITKELYDKLEKYREYRNILVHKILLDYRYFNSRKMNDLGKEISKELIDIIKEM